MSSDEPIHPRLQRIENLRAKLRARSGAGRQLFKENCQAIEQEIARLEKIHTEELASQETSDGSTDS